MRKNILLLSGLLLIVLGIALSSLLLATPRPTTLQLVLFAFFIQIFLVMGVNVLFISHKLKKVRKTLEAHTEFLEKRIQQKDDFISMTSHELKTPITSVKAFAQILIRHNKEKDPFSCKYLQKIDQQVDLLTVMINDFLDVSRIQTGKMTYHREPFCYYNTLIDVVEQMRQISHGHKIILRGRCKKWVHADKQRISQVLINLISNAIKYSPGANKVNIRITASKTHITTEIQDFGIGIGATEKKYIFNRFYQAHRNSDMRFTGLGLGLYITHEIVQYHKARIRVKSKKGVGSTFYFSLPIYQYETA